MGKKFQLKSRENLRRCLNQILQKWQEFPGDFLASVTKVEEIDDAKAMRVGIDCYPDVKAKEALRILKKNKQMIKKELFLMLPGRRIKELFFYFDKGNIEDDGVDSL